MSHSFYKCDPFNFVPFARTPWAGTQISDLKKTYFPWATQSISLQIGESWEVSTDAQFPSKVHIGEKQVVPLTEFLNQHAAAIVGKDNFHDYGAHFPILLKWLEASSLLSVQLHPHNNNPLLKSNESGKPEAWLVMNVKPGGFVYLGFKEGMTAEEILNHLKNDEPQNCLHKYFPKKYDYISVPPGCVHAVGPGVLVAEPQYVLPQKIAKTWRISDWKRRYNGQGQLCDQGLARELHTLESLPAIDFNLPQGEALEKMLIQNMGHSVPFEGSANNPFAVQVFCQPGQFEYCHLKPGSFSLFSVFSGHVRLTSPDGQVLVLHGGESGFVCAETQKINVECVAGDNAACIAFFALKESHRI